jgi:hypothetical protein
LVKSRGCRFASEGVSNMQFVQQMSILTIQET